MDEKDVTLAKIRLQNLAEMALGNLQAYVQDSRQFWQMHMAQFSPVQASGQRTVDESGSRRARRLDTTAADIKAGA